MHITEQHFPFVGVSWNETRMVGLRPPIGNGRGTALDDFVPHRMGSRKKTQESALVSITRGRAVGLSPRGHWSAQGNCSRCKEGGSCNAP